MLWGERARRARCVITTAIAASSVLWFGAVPAAADGVVDLTITQGLSATQGGGFTAPNTFMTGAKVSFDVDLTCSGTADCGTVTLDDSLDPALSFVSASSSSPNVSVVPAGNGATITVGTAAAPLTAGSSVRVTLIALVKPSASPGTASNMVLAHTGDVFREARPAEVIIARKQPQWRLAKTAPETAAPGDTVTYRIDFEGSPYGNWGIMNFALADTYPARAVVVDAGGGTVDEAAHTISWPFTVADLDAAKGVCVAADGWCRPKPYTNGVATVTLRYPAEAFPAGQTVTNEASARVVYMSETGGQLAAQAKTLLRAPVETSAPVATTQAAATTPTGATPPVTAATPPVAARALPITGSEEGVGLIPVALGVVAAVALVARRRSVR